MPPNGLLHIDIDATRAKYEQARPFPFFVLDDLLEPEFAVDVAKAFPSFEAASSIGLTFTKVNETGKVQITDASHFPEPVKRLHAALSSPEFLETLTAITGIPNLIADPLLRGGGMHITRRAGRLDVHADFNFLEPDKLFRRLNVLVYLNPRWEPAWGGGLELWDEDVRTREFYAVPKLGRCVVFRTTKTSFHGVERVECPPEFQRQSFAAYYYTREPHPDWDGTHHSTIFRARPDERLRGLLLMPAEAAAESAKRLAARIARRLGNPTGR